MLDRSDGGTLHRHLAHLAHSALMLLAVGIIAAALTTAGVACHMTGDRLVDIRSGRGGVTEH